MPTNPTQPGVHITEVPSGMHPISGVDTSIALILGRATEGALNTPTLCRSYLDYEREFSGDNSLSEMSHQVKLFFSNGGSICYVIRLPSSAQEVAGVAAGPTLAEYEAAYLIADEKIDLFNLMLLPRDAKPSQPMNHLYGPASVFCERRRAFLLMEAPDSWTDSQTASSNIANLRVGLVNDHAAVFYPKLTINDDGKDIHIGPVGAIAGVIARIDSTRGVWKAPAGTDASLRGVIGMQFQFSDAETDVLNPKGINTIRMLSGRVVNWGARTMDGSDSFVSEYKYIPVRRLALFIEESLSRGLKWAVFEPNNESLWSQIRMNVIAFMHNLFREGAFQGSTRHDAYFVKCDHETTTQADQSLGVVNITIGFAPLKPAEFIVFTLQQVAGQS